MANEIKIFDNPQFGEIRTSGTSEKPMFCLADVCRVLNLQVTPTKNRLKPDGVSLIKVIDSLGREQEATFINEQNLYKVIMRSDKPQAEPFQDWVCGEVLPSIRKTGQYSLAIPSYQISDPIKRAEKWIEEEKQRQQLAIDNQKKAERIEQDKPKVIFADAVSTSQRSCLVAELAKILKQNGVNMGQNRLFDWLRKHGYLCSKGQYYNQPTQRAQELGLFEMKQTTINKPDGSILVSTTTKVTGKGQIYFVNKFLNDSNVGRAAV